MNEKLFRTRNPWLVLPWALGLMILISLPQVLFVGLGDGLPGWVDGDPRIGTLALGKGILSLVAGIAVSLLVLRTLWRRPAEWMGMTPQPRKLFRGFFWGILAPLPPLAILLFAGVAKIEAAPMLGAPLVAIQMLAGYLLFWLYAAAVEEMVFRGMVARELAARQGWLKAWLIGGAFFGLIHFQPSYGAMGGLWLLAGGILVSGLFLALYLRSRTLWLPIGFHCGWNFCMTNLIGAPMSGVDASAGLLSTSVEGSTIMTGGEFGIEISIVTLLFYGIYAMIVLKLPRGNGAALLSAAAPPEPLEL